MDCGSTVFRLCPFIRHKRIAVVTNSLPVVAELMGSDVAVNLVGGEVDKERQAVHGLMAEEHIARYRANRAFIGVDGISLAKGRSQHRRGNGEAGYNDLPALRLLEIGNREIFLFCTVNAVQRPDYG